LCPLCDTKRTAGITGQWWGRSGQSYSIPAPATVTLLNIAWPLASVARSLCRQGFRAIYREHMFVPLLATLLLN